MLRLVYGNYEFALTPEIEIERKAHHDDNVEKSGDVETWILKGELIADNVDSLSSQVTSFNTAFALDKENLQLKNGQNVLLSLNAQECWKSPRILSAKLYGSENDQNFVRNLKFELQILGEKPSAQSNVVYHKQHIEISENVRKKITKTVRGEYRVLSGFTASGYLNVVTPSVNAGMKREEVTYETDSEDTVITYKIVDVTEFEELPSEVYDGYIIESEESSDEGKFKLLQGVFYGSGALIQAKALKPSVGVVSYKISENPQEQKVEFVYKQRVKSDGQSVSKKVQRISYETKLSFKDFKLLGKDVPDLRQKLGNSDYLIIQEGYAVCENVYPSPANPVQNSEMIERLIVYEFPEGADDSKIYKTRWKFVMKPLKPFFEQGLIQN